MTHETDAPASVGNWLRPEPAAALLGISAVRLAELSALGRVPRPLMIDPDAPLWSRAEIVAFVVASDKARREVMKRDGFLEVVRGVL